MPKWNPEKGCWEQTAAPEADVKSDETPVPAPKVVKPTK